MIAQKVEMCFNTMCSATGVKKLFGGTLLFLFRSPLLDRMQKHAIKHNYFASAVNKCILDSDPPPVILPLFVAHIRQVEHDGLFFHKVALYTF